MKFNLDIFCKVIIPFLTLLFGAWLNRFLERKVKLIAYFGHAFTVDMKNPSGQPIRINGHGIVVLNAGKLVANNVRITHNFLPNFSVYPSASYSTYDLPDGKKQIVFTKLLPGEQVAISYLYFPPDRIEQIYDHSPSVIKSDEALGKVITVIPSPQYPKWLTNSITTLIIIGITSLLYWFFIFITFLNDIVHVI